MGSFHWDAVGVYFCRDRTQGHQPVTCKDHLEAPTPPCTNFPSSLLLRDFLPLSIIVEIKYWDLYPFYNLDKKKVYTISMQLMNSCSLPDTVLGTH